MDPIPKECRARGPWHFMSAEHKALWTLYAGKKAQAMAKKIIKLADLIDLQFAPYVPLRRNAEDQGGRPPYLQEGSVVVSDNAIQTVTVHHPQDGSFFKYEARKGMRFWAHKTYVSPLLYRQWLLALWKLSKIYKDLAGFCWRSYGAVSDCGDMYLAVEGVTPNSKLDENYLTVPHVCLVAYDWEGIVARHEKIAVQYYLQGNFGPTVSERQQRRWVEMTRAAETAPTALKLKNICQLIHEK